jgi:hypothetical protein
MVVAENVAAGVRVRNELVVVTDLPSPLIAVTVTE